MSTTDRFEVVSFPGLPSWGWVRLEQLAEAMERSCQDVLVSFIPLSKDCLPKVGNPMLKVVMPGRSELQAITTWWGTVSFVGYKGEITPGQKMAIDQGDVYLPAGFAREVWQAHLSGVHYVTPEVHHYHGEDACPEGALRCGFNGFQFEAAVGCDRAGRPVIVED